MFVICRLCYFIFIICYLFFQALSRGNLLGWLETRLAQNTSLRSPRPKVTSVLTRTLLSLAWLRQYPMAQGSAAQRSIRKPRIRELRIVDCEFLGIPCGLRNSTQKIRNLLEPNPLNSRLLLRELTVQLSCRLRVVRAS